MKRPPESSNPASRPLRAIAYFDGQNLFKAAKQLFGHRHPNYDVVALARRVCEAQGWNLSRVHFYTGVPPRDKSPKWRGFWKSKLRHMRRRGAVVFSRDLRYRRTPDGTERPEEKGVDVRIAVDIIRAVLRGECEVVLVFSQDQDLSEVAKEIPAIARERRGRIKIASAFPFDESVRDGGINLRGVNNTQWIKITRADYDACLDPRDHFSRPKKSARSVPPRREAA